MPTAVIDGTAIRDWESFHDECARKLGFPGFYGRNLNAFVDCLNYLEQDVGMTRFVLKPGETLDVRITNSADLQSVAPDILQALRDSIGYVNRNYDERGLPALVRLIEE